MSFIKIPIHLVFSTLERKPFIYSENWINKNNLTEEKFHWQDEYFAVSVSESLLDQVRNYIINQEKHHSKKTFSKEYLEFIEKYNFRNSGK